MKIELLGRVNSTHDLRRLMRQAEQEEESQGGDFSAAGWLDNVAYAAYYFSDEQRSIILSAVEEIELERSPHAVEQPNQSLHEVFFEGQNYSWDRFERGWLSYEEYCAARAEENE